MDENAFEELLKRLAAGDSRARDELVHLIYQELRTIARRLMASQKPDHTLQATALVHEAFCKVFNTHTQPKDWKDKKHCLRYLARAMHTILIDRAKQRKLRGPRKPLDGIIDDLARQGMDPTQLEQGLLALEEVDPELAEVVELRIFGGYDWDECAAILGVSRSTAVRRWKIALAWLRRELGRD